MTPARLAANQRNARKSTGPRTARGKAFSRMNGLRTGSRSPLYRDLFLALHDAPPGVSVDCVVKMFLTPEQASHPLFADLIGVAHDVERRMSASANRAGYEFKKKEKCG